MSDFMYNWIVTTAIVLLLVTAAVLLVVGILLTVMVSPWFIIMPVVGFLMGTAFVAAA